MAREKKLEAPVTLFAGIEVKQHDALRTIAFQERRSIADVVRQAIDEFTKRRSKLVKPQRIIVVGRKKVTAAHV